MSKPGSDILFQLIRSLSKSEKRAFKLYCDRTGGQKEKKVTLLFDHISNQKKYDEEKILKKEKSLKRAQMANLKAYLYNEIMKCLSLVTEKNTEMKINMLLGYSRILYNKCLYNESLRMLAKAKQHAANNDTKVLLLEILELEKLILRQTVYEGNETMVNKIISQTDSTAKSIHNINTFSNLALKLNSFYQRTGFIRNNRDYDKVKRFFYSSLPKYDLHKLSFQEKLYLFYSFTGYYFFIQDFRSGYRYAKNWVELFEKVPAMIYQKPDMYLRAINSMLVAQNKLILYNEFNETHRKLVLLKRDKKFSCTENINLNLFKTIYIHEINRHFMLGEFTRGTKMVKKLERELDVLMHKLDRHTVLILYYKIACLYFGAGNFKAAAKWLNRIINEKETGLREDLHAFARILCLISYYEAGDEELLEHSFKSTYRFLVKQGALNKYQQLILGFLKNVKRFDSRKKLLSAFSELKKEMQKLSKSKYEKRAFLYFDIISWLESKIETRPVEMVIREKARLVVARENSRK